MLLEPLLRTNGGGVPVSEHGEPKTALTRLLGEHHPHFVKSAYPSWECSCGEWDGAMADDGSDTDGQQDTSEGHAAHLADVLLAEGYTTSPAPEATERCGYAILDADGIEEPCDRPATGWRWYQDVGDHEDLLDLACDHHQNEGGRRMARIAAENERLRNTLADVRAQHTEARRQLLAAPEATETVEWRGTCTHGATEQVSGSLGVKPTCGDDAWLLMERRTVTSYADRFTEWVPVDRAADEHEEGGQ